MANKKNCKSPDYSQTHFQQLANENFVLRAKRVSMYISHFTGVLPLY